MISNIPIAVLILLRTIQVLLEVFVNLVRTEAFDDDGNPLFDEDGVTPCADRPDVTGFQDRDGFSPLGSVIRNIAITNDIDQFQFDLDWVADNWSVAGGFSWIDYQVDTLSDVYRFLLPRVGRL